MLNNWVLHSRVSDRVSGATSRNFWFKVIKLIDASHTVKDLGVIMSSDCMFDDHIVQVTKKCSQLCGWILRTFENISELLMLTLFKSSVLSRIDYASQLWSLYKKATSVH